MIKVQRSEQEENQVFNGFGKVLFKFNMKHSLAAKTNYGVKSGKYMFEIKILELVEPDEFQGDMSLEKNECIRNN